MANKKKIIPLIALVLVFIMPLAVAYILFIYHTPPSHKTVNHGQLINPPIDVSQLPMIADLKTHWLLAYYSPDACQQPCFENVYYIAQIKKALGKKQNYVKPVFITDHALSSSDKQQLTKHYPSVHYFVLNNTNHQQWQNLLHNDQTGIYLIDPQSRVMMAYASGHDAKQILQDIQRLLKNTH